MDNIVKLSKKSTEEFPSAIYRVKIINNELGKIANKTSVIR